MFNTFNPLAVYTKGEFDGKGFKLYEVGKYLLDQPLYGSTMFLGMHQRTWDSFPADLQKIFMDCTKTFTDDWIDTSYKQENINSKKMVKK